MKIVKQATMRILRMLKLILVRLKFIFCSDEKYARSLGVKMGKDCRIASHKWGSEPYLIEIGNRVHITSGVSFVTHDGGAWVFREEIRDFDVFGKIKIGDNTYIGNNAIIMPGVSIGKNCVIGAASVITKSIPDNSVVAGNPARFIRSTLDYKQRILPLNAHTKNLSTVEKRKAVLNLPAEKAIIKQWLKC